MSKYSVGNSCFCFKKVLFTLKFLIWHIGPHGYCWFAGQMLFRRDAGGNWSGVHHGLCLFLISEKYRKWKYFTTSRYFSVKTSLFQCWWKRRSREGNGPSVCNLPYKQLPVFRINSQHNDLNRMSALKDVVRAKVRSFSIFRTWR